MSYEDIRVNEEGRIATITVDRQGKVKICQEAPPRTVMNLNGDFKKR